MPGPKAGRRNGNFKQRRKSKKTYRRKPYISTLASSPTRYPGFPKNKYVMMRYVTRFAGDLSTGNQIQVVYRANSINDPEFALGGHQPMGYDQWEQFYSSYTVTGAKCTIEVIGDVSIGKATNISLNLTTASTDTRSALEKIESGDTVYKVLAGFSNIGRPVKLTKYYDPKKFHNIKDIKDNQAGLGAFFGSNPVEEAYFTATVDCVDGGVSTPGDIQGLVTIEYMVLLSDPKILPQS